MIGLTQMIVVAIIFISIANIVACSKSSIAEPDEEDSGPTQGSEKKQAIQYDSYGDPIP